MISIDQTVTGLIYLLAVFVLLLLGKLIYDRLRPRVNVADELFQRDNFAFALAVVGYYAGLVIALSGVLLGPNKGLVDDLLDIGFYGLVAILLLNISAWLNDKLILNRFDNHKEIFEDRNAGTGAVEAGNHIANGLILSGALSGEGDLVTAIAFWALGQGVLILASRVYDFILPFDLHDEIEKDNVAVGVAFSGVLIALGNISRISVGGDFLSWRENLLDYAWFLLVALLMLPAVRWLTDRLLVPGAKLTDELVNQEEANVGAGLLEAFSYIAASVLIGWLL